MFDWLDRLINGPEFNEKGERRDYRKANISAPDADDLPGLEDSEEDEEGVVKVEGGSLPGYKDPYSIRGVGEGSVGPKNDPDGFIGNAYNQRENKQYPPEKPKKEDYAEYDNPDKAFEAAMDRYEELYAEYISSKDSNPSPYPIHLPSMTDNEEDPNKSTLEDRNERAKEMYDLYIAEGDTSPAKTSDLEDFFMELPGNVKDLASSGLEGLKNIGTGIGETVSDFTEPSGVNVYDFDPYIAERYYMDLLLINPTMAEGYKDMYMRRKNLEKVKTSTGVTGNMAEQVRQKESDIAVKQEIASKLGELKSGLADGTITKNDTKYNSIYTELMTMYGKLYNPPSRNEYEKMIDADIKSETLDLNKEKFTFDKEKELNDNEEYAIDLAIKNSQTSKDKLDNMSTKLRGAVANMNQAISGKNLPAFLTGLKGFISGIDDSAVMGEEFQMFNTVFNNYKEAIGGLLGGLLEASAGVTYDGTKVSGILHALNNTISALKNSYSAISKRANDVYKEKTGKNSEDNVITKYFSGLDVPPVKVAEVTFVVKDAIDAKKVAELASSIIGGGASAVANIITGGNSDSKQPQKNRQQQQKDSPFKGLL